MVISGSSTKGSRPLRRTWSVHLDWIGQDLTGGLRRLARRPGFTFLAAGTLALGLSTSTAVFTYVNAYGRPVPGAGADNLHEIWLATEEAPWGALSYPDFEDLVKLNGTQFSVTGVGRSSFFATVRRGQFTGVSKGETVAGGFFSVLGIEMSVGRGFSAEDDRPGAVPVTVISHDYWVSQYEADPDLPGRATRSPASPAHGRRGHMFRINVPRYMVRMTRSSKSPIPTTVYVT